MPDQQSRNPHQFGQPTVLRPQAQPGSCFLNGAHSATAALLCSQMVTQFELDKAKRVICSFGFYRFYYFILPIKSINGQLM